jgi:regulator of ribonuclease activity A
MKFSTCDLCDANEKLIEEGTLRALPPLFRHFGLQQRFYGEVATMRVFEDNALVRAELEKPGEKRVLVIDGGASLRCALVGGNLAALAARNGWAGLIVNGAVRDRDEVDDTNIAIRALGLCPVRAAKRGQGDLAVPVTVAGLRIVPGSFVYGDADGVIISDRALL